MTGFFASGVCAIIAIETAEQAVELAALGCDYGQGFLFSRQLPEADAFARLSALQPFSERLSAA